MTKTFFKPRWTVLPNLRMSLAYARHLLQQKVTLQKRQLMRYFALNFFAGGDVYKIQYEGQQRRLIMVLRSPNAVDHACDLEWAKRSKASNRPRDTLTAINREDFQYEAVFTDVHSINTKYRHRDSRSLPFWLYDCAELADVHEEEFPEGLSWLRLRFLEGSLLELAFKTVRVRPVFPKRMVKYHAQWRHSPPPTLLVGRDLKKSLQERIRWYESQIARLELARKKGRKSR